MLTSESDNGMIRPAAELANEFANGKDCTFGLSATGLARASAPPRYLQRSLPKLGFCSILQSSKKVGCAWTK
jgi:hypothetical protein